MTDNPIDDRRQRAREAGQDASSVASDDVPRAINTAIEVATQVKITKDIVMAYAESMDGEFEGALADAFRAAGFEVIE